MPSNFMIIRARQNIAGHRFNTKAGETMRIRYGYERPDFIPRIVSQCRAGQAIDWGGASVQPQDYEVLFDGPGPVPTTFAPVTPPWH